jgi:hypothetical protein
MERKVRTLAEVRKERFDRIAADAKALGNTALSAIDEVLEQNAQVIQFPERPDPNPPEVVA